jgi:stage V sporulation protein SpoVS
VPADAHDHLVAGAWLGTLRDQRQIRVTASSPGLKSGSITVATKA